MFVCSGEQLVWVGARSDFVSWWRVVWSCHYVEPGAYWIYPGHAVGEVPRGTRNSLAPCCPCLTKTCKLVVWTFYLDPPLAPSLRWSSYIEMVQFGVEFGFPHLCSFPIFELFCNCNCIPIRTQPTQNWPARCIYSLPSQNARGFEKGKRQSEQISLKCSRSFYLEKIGFALATMVMHL